MRLTLPRAAVIAVALAFSTNAFAASQCAQAASSAQDLRASGKLLKARAQLAVCAQKTCNSVVRSDCEKWLKEVDAQTPSVIVRALDARGKDVLGVTATIDDEVISLDGNPVKVDPGKRSIRASARSGDIAEQLTLIAQGEKGRVIELKFDQELTEDGTRIVAAPPAPAPAPAPERAPVAPSRNVVPIALAAVGGAAFLSFLFFELKGQSDFSDLQSGCGNTPAGCTEDEKGPVKTKFVIAGVTLGVSVVALTAAAIVYFTQKPSAASARKPFALTF